MHEFNKFLDDVHAKITTLSDGEIKVDVNQRLHGGMMGHVIKAGGKWAIRSGLVAVLKRTIKEFWHPNGTSATATALEVIDGGGNFKTWVEHVEGDINHTLFFANKTNSGIGLGKYTQAKLISEATTIYQKLQINGLFF